MLGAIFGAITATVAGVVILEPYQPFATKAYVERTLNDRLAPLVKEVNEQSIQADKQSALTASLTVQSLNYQIIMMQTTVNRLKPLVDAGNASASDQSLYETLKEEIRKSTRIRDSAEAAQ